MIKGPLVKAVAKGALLWNQESCAHAGPCGRCEESCPTGVLFLGSPFVAGDFLDSAFCIRCRMCVVYCPTDALSFIPEIRTSAQGGQDPIFQQ